MNRFTTLEEFVRKEVEKEHMINIYERKLQELAQQLRAKEEENSTIHQLLSQEQQKREAFEEIHKQQKVKATELDAKQVGISNTSDETVFLFCFCFQF